MLSEDKKFNGKLYVLHGGFYKKVLLNKWQGHLGSKVIKLVL